MLLNELSVKFSGSPGIQTDTMASRVKSASKQSSNFAVGKGASRDPAVTHGKRSTITKSSRLSRQGSSIELLSADDEDSDGSRPSSATSHLTNGTSRPSSSSSSRPGSSSRRAPPIKRGDSARSLNTPPPSKQVSLQTVRRRKEASDDLGELNWAEAEAAESDRLSSAQQRRRREQQLAKGVQKLSVSDQPADQPSSSDTASGDNNNRSDQVNLEDSDAFDTDLEDGDGSDESSDEEVVIKAPNELMMEFLECVMTGDWPNAKKLCGMILMYEPENPEALGFKDLIEEKIRRGEEESEGESSDGDEDSSDDEDVDDFFGSSSESGSDEENDDDDDDDDDEEEEAETAADDDDDGKKDDPTKT